MKKNQRSSHRKTATERRDFGYDMGALSRPEPAHPSVVAQGAYAR